MDYDYKLIQEVTKHPCLYDKECPDFRKTNIKRKAWQDVTEAVTDINKWKSMTLEQRLNQVDTVKRDWQLTSRRRYKAPNANRVPGNEAASSSTRKNKNDKDSELLLSLLAPYKTLTRSEQMELNSKALLWIAESHKSRPPKPVKFETGLYEFDGKLIPERFLRLNPK